MPKVYNTCIIRSDVWARMRRAGVYPPTGARFRIGPLWVATAYASANPVYRHVASIGLLTGERPMNRIEEDMQILELRDEYIAQAMAERGQLLTVDSNNPIQTAQGSSGMPGSTR